MNRPMTITPSFLEFVDDPDVLAYSVSMVPGVGPDNAHIFEQYGLETVSYKVETDIRVKQRDDKNFQTQSFC